jgi:sec-independent protein translocase protein TatB
MFGIGFLELVTVFLVGLVVLGPEKLPGTIRTVSLWVGRLRRNFNNIKSEIEKEIGADEIRRQLRNEEIMEKFRATQNKVQESIQTLRNDTETFRRNVELEAQAAAGKITGEDNTASTTGTSDSPAAPEASVSSESATSPQTAPEKDASQT